MQEPGAWEAGPHQRKMEAKALARGIILIDECHLGNPYQIGAAVGNAI